MKIEIFQGKRADWFWHFVARNGRLIADSEPFPTKAHAMRAAKAAVRSVIKPWTQTPVIFYESKSRAGRIVLRWS